MLMMTGGVHALTKRECYEKYYEKYKAAKRSKTLHGRTLGDFRRAECGSEVSKTPTSIPESASTTTAPKAEKPKSASTTTAPKAEKKEATRPAAVPRRSAISLSGAWTTDVSRCNKVFVKRGARVSFAEDSELVGGGLIIQGGEVQGTGASCRIKTTKEDGEMTHMILACATIIMHSEQQFSVRKVSADEIVRLFPNMEGMETKYYRCPM